ncbi:MAG: hypothetical protein J6K04_08185 [Lachnospiraceae bacterium]|nr:hypothetical protein [Lachnospiraceae bacterium]
MKKFIALGAALVALLLSFVPAAEVADVQDGICVCSDAKPHLEPYD